MRKNFIVISTLLLLFIMVACSKKPISNQDQIIVGGLYAFHNEDKTYGVLQVLTRDDSYVHYIIFQNKFKEIPKDINILKLSELDGFEDGDFVFTPKEFWERNPIFLKKEDIKDNLPIKKQLNLKKVTASEFIALLKSSGSKTLQNELKRLDLEGILGGYNGMCFVYEGDLNITSDWQPEAENLIIKGSINSTGFMNMAPSSGKDDEGGSFWVLGNVTCRHFANYFGKAVFVDGNMKVSEIVINDFEDASLIVTGDFETGFFNGWDIWVEVGGKITLNYGIGYGLPLGYTNAETQAVEPKHDRKTSLKLLGLDEDYEQGELFERIKSKQSYFLKK